jgi:hypothetical protein
MEHSSIDFSSLTIVDEQLVAGGEITLAQLWLVQDNDNIHGPYLESDLRSFLLINGEMCEHLMVCNMLEEKWLAVFQARAFQRRKPQLISETDLTQNQEFYLANQAQKTGPYTSDQIKELIELGNLLMSDSISTDKGKTWLKVYQHAEFDRRDLDAHENLPINPRLNPNQMNKLSLIKSEEIDALAGLAYLKNKKINGIDQDIDPDHSFKNKKAVAQSSNTTPFNYQKYGLVIGIFLMVGVLALSSLGSKKPDQLSLNREKASRKIASIKNNNEDRKADSNIDQNINSVESQSRPPKSNFKPIHKKTFKPNVVRKNSNAKKVRIPRSPIRGVTQLSRNNNNQRNRDYEQDQAVEMDERMIDPRDEFKDDRSPAAKSNDPYSNNYQDERYEADQAMRDLHRDVEADFQSLGNEF